MIRLVLRALAIAIAVAALIDPVLSSPLPPALPVVAIRLTSSPPDQIERALGADLGGRELVTRALVGNRLPCAPDEDCVVIADGSIDADWDTRTDHPVSLITMAADGQPNVSVESVLMSNGHRSAVGAARVQLAGRGVEGKRTEVRILDAGAVVGSAAYQWSVAPAATIEVPWLPLDAGARSLRVEAVPVEGEITAVDNSIDVGVMVSETRAPILVFDARPSWSSTFVRRALEEDPRFVVGYRSRIAPALTAGTPAGRLDAQVLNSVAMIVAGAPEALTAEDVDLLERFVRVRGGTLVLLPEQRPGGAAARLFPANAGEHLTASAERIGTLHATEVLRWSEAPAISTVIARSGALPAIISTPLGNGRVIVSGAMDAWRYRDLDSGAFDRFWRSLAAQGAAMGEGLLLTFEQGIAASGSRARFTVRDRRLEPRGSIEAIAVAQCNNGPAEVVRLWPGGTPGEFAGEVPAASPGQCTIEASVDDRGVAGSIAIVDRPARGADRTIAKLEHLVRASGGVVAHAGEEELVARAVAADPRTMSRVVSLHPMRAPWWILPFAGCVSIEWWLRRRDGLR